MPAGNSNFTALLSTTIENFRPTFADNLSQSFLLMYWLTTQGRKQNEDGGESIVVPLMYGKNTTVKSYSGYDIIDSTPQEGLTAAKYPWKQVAGTVSISRLERRQNSGEQRIINLLESKIKQTEITMRDELNRMFYADGTGNDSNDIFGLDLLVEDGTAWGTLGGIDRSDAANAWWRNQWVGAVGAAGMSNMRAKYNQASRGNEHVDLILMDRDNYGKFEATQVQNQRYVDERVASAGFEVLKFKGALVGFDEQIGTGKVFGLNSNYIGFTVDSETDMITTEFVSPSDQDVETAKFLLMGNMVASNCARQFRLDGVTDFTS